MRCPSLHDLPPAPAGKTGWPWTAEGTRQPPGMPGGGEWPLISIVTPSFNQGDYLEATIRSILLQGYPNLETIVMDGGSTDGSVAIIQRYAPWLAHWETGPDGGQYAAIQARDGLELLEAPRVLDVVDGQVRISLSLPVHSVSLLVLE